MQGRGAISPKKGDEDEASRCPPLAPGGLAWWCTRFGFLEKRSFFFVCNSSRRAKCRSLQPEYESVSEPLEKRKVVNRARASPMCDALRFRIHYLGLM